MNLHRLIEEHLPRPLLDLVGQISTRAAGRDERAYLVGGAVRDLLLGRPNLDLDLVIEGDAVQLTKELAESGQADLLACHRFGTATLGCGDHTLDVATARSETYAHPGALPEVTPGTIRDDLARRDFSINAMAVSLSPDDHGELIDLYGGRTDLEQRLVRVLHPGSFRDDATRILRGVRYEQRFGFEFESQTAGLLRQDLHMLDTISGDRIRHELELILNEREPENAIKRLADLGVLTRINLVVEGEVEIAGVFRKARRMTGPEQLPALYLCLLIYPSTPQQLEAVISRLNMPTRPSRAMCHTLRLKNSLKLLDRPSSRPSEIYDLLKDHDVLAIQANAIASESSSARSSLDLFLRNLRHVRPSLAGEDLKKLGIPPGPEMGRIIRALHRARLDGEVTTREDEERLALSLKAAASYTNPEF
jgi:tRNA nucleotidyltransferase (CCA-adding enzyme)